jgi:hypothetical protein
MWRRRADRTVCELPAPPDGGNIGRRSAFSRSDTSRPRPSRRLARGPFGSSAEKRPTRHFRSFPVLLSTVRRKRQGRFQCVARSMQSPPLRPPYLRTSSFVRSWQALMRCAVPPRLQSASMPPCQAKSGCDPANKSRNIATTSRAVTKVVTATGMTPGVGVRVGQDAD